ncbi:MAG: leucine-rich repeat protein [Prevotella sp.]|nr:leucine-rich repeat protein [Prevotella sp.]
MMKQQYITFLLTVIMSMVGTRAFADWDTSTKIQVDGLYYYLDNENMQAEVTSWGSGRYMGNIEIPVDIVYEGKVYSVTSIGSSAFQYCINVTSVTIGNSVVNIDQSAFEGCSGLTSIEIPNSVTYIGYMTFSGCSRLTSITIPNSVTYIGVKAFTSCSNLTSMIVESGNIRYDSRENCNAIIETSTNKLISGCKNSFIPNSVASIGNNAFDGCSGLTSINIPNSVTSIGMSAFQGCSGLTSVTIPNSVTRIRNRTFSGCSDLASVNLPNSVTSIEANAFYGCSDLFSVTIPNSVTSIDNGAFQSCPHLTSVTLKSNAIVSKEYSGSNNMKNIFGNQVKNYIIGDDVTSIGGYAFYGCTRLTSVIIGNNVASIGNNAFQDCSYLASVIISNNVASIGNNAFQDCSYLTSVTLNSNTIISKAYTESNNMKNIFGNQVKNYIIGDDVTSIGDNVFYSCTSLTSVTISNSVKSIGSSAFSSCSHLTTVTMGNSVTHIDNYAFENCTGLTKVIASDIAAWCRIYFANSLSNPLYFARHLYSDESIEIKDLVIPNSITYIGNYIFYNCEGLTSLTIPNSVTSIGYSAFRGCSKLTSVTIPNDMTRVEGFAFVGCTSLTSVTLNSNAVASKAYTYSDNFKNIFGEQVTEYVIGDDVTSIGDNAFYGCTDLASVTIGRGVTSIGYMTFYGCSGLTSVNIPDNVTTISDYAFRDCSGLEFLTIGNGMTSYGNSAFYCSKLVSVTVFNPTPVAITQNVFTNRKNATLYVPKGSKSAYEVADYWKEFKEIVEIDDIIPGDANKDKQVNVTDIVAMVNYIMNKPSTDFDFDAADVNEDGEVNVTDIVATVNIIMKGDN